MNERHILDYKSVQLRGLLDGGHRASSEMLLLVFTSDRVLMTEDEVDLHGVV